VTGATENTLSVPPLKWAYTSDVPTLSTGCVSCTASRIAWTFVFVALFTVTASLVIAKSVEPVSTSATLTLVREPETLVSKPGRLSGVPSTVTTGVNAVAQLSGVAVGPDALLSSTFTPVAVAVRMPPRFTSPLSPSALTVTQRFVFSASVGDRRPTASVPSRIETCASAVPIVRNFVGPVRSRPNVVSVESVGVPSMFALSV